MNTITDYKIAFIGWNPFQLIHIKDLAQKIPHSVFIIEERINNNIKFFQKELLDTIGIPIISVKEKDVLSLDQKYDILIVQTYFKNLHKFKKAKIVMLQYGYAKEPHNYGTWRSIASLCLTYGEYASKKISPYCPCVATGNPKYDKWHNPAFHIQMKLKYSTHLTHTKTILYMPTWGSLSSFDFYIDEIIKLSEKYNILVKVHHNSDFFENKNIFKNTKIHFFGSNNDNIELLSISDLVISDYSGALFDAVYCKKPILLLNIPKTKLLHSKKIDQFSLEFIQRDDIGTAISSPLLLSSTIENIISHPDVIIQKAKSLHLKLFTSTTDASTNIIDTLLHLMENKYKKTQSQIYIQETVIKLYNKQCISDIFIQFIKKIYTYMIH